MHSDIYVALAENTDFINLHLVLPKNEVKKGKILLDYLDITQ